VQVLKTPFQVRHNIRRKSIAADVVETQLQLPAEPTTRQYGTLSLPAALVSGSGGRGGAGAEDALPGEARYQV
jgi:hypothetical protein